MDTQNRMILQHLESGKPITPLEALNLYGCFRLSARIFELREELREQGLEIITGKKKVVDRFGNEKIVAQYWLKGESADDGRRT